MPLPRDNVFNFVLDAGGAGAGDGRCRRAPRMRRLYLSRALAIGEAPRFDDVAAIARRRSPAMR